MNSFLIRFCLALCLLLPLTHSTTAASADNTELHVFKAQTEARLESAKENQQKDLQLHQQLVTSQNERIEQINHQVDWLGHLITQGSIIITLLLVVIGYFAYGKAKSDAESIAKTVARDEANTTSKAEVKKWFDENLVAVNNKINTLNNEINTLKVKLKEVYAHAEQVHQEIDKIKTDLQAQISNATSTLSADAKSALTAADKQTLADANTSLQDKPESQYTFDDWDTRAYAAYAESNLALAAEYWKNAARASRATDEQLAQALCNQGVVLGKQNKSDEAIACYQQFVQRFGDSTLLTVQEQMAKVLVYHGMELGQQNKLDEAIARYRQVVQRFGDSTLPALQDWVANALIGHGFIQLITAKKMWDNQTARTELLTESTSLLERATEKAQTNSCKAMALGKLSYALWLLGRDAKAETPLHQALTLGGEKTFNDENADTKISAVPADSGFEQLVTKLWSEIST